MKPDSFARGMDIAIALYALVGLVSVAVIIAFGRLSSPFERAVTTSASIGATVEYGKRPVSADRSLLQESQSPSSSKNESKKDKQ